MRKFCQEGGVIMAHPEEPTLPEDTGQRKNKNINNVLHDISRFLLSEIQRRAFLSPKLLFQRNIYHIIISYIEHVYICIILIYRNRLTKCICFQLICYGHMVPYKYGLTN